MNNLLNIESIKIENITKFFGQTKILENINFEFKKNNSYLIKGQSGVGKSTLINMLSGLESQTSGSIYYNKINISQIDKNQKNKILQNSIGLMFQNPYLIKELNILENIIIKSLMLGKNKKDLQESALDLLEKLDLKDKYLSYPSSLSSGQQQRIALARALFNNPDFLIADEPTANLDEKNKSLILDLISDFQKNLNTGLIVISHDNIMTKKIDNQIEIKNSRIFY